MVSVSLRQKKLSFFFLFFFSYGKRFILWDHSNFSKDTLYARCCQQLYKANAKDFPLRHEYWQDENKCCALFHQVIVREDILTGNAAIVRFNSSDLSNVYLISIQMTFYLDDFQDLPWKGLAIVGVYCIFQLTVIHMCNINDQIK